MTEPLSRLTPRPLYPGAAALGEQKDLPCDHCGSRWTVPAGLAGVSVRCRDCGEMIAIAAPPAPPAEKVRKRLPVSRRRGQRDVWALQRQTRRGQLPLQAAEDPDRGLVGMLDDAPVQVRSAWTNRTLIELVAVMVAFLGPILLLALLTVGEVRFSLMPVASVISGALVLLIGCSCPGFAFGAIRRPQSRHMFEAVLMIVPIALLGHGWMEMVTVYWPEMVDHSFMEEATSFGLPAVLFVMALCPGIFEEIAFRGIVQARLTALFGAMTGGLYAAVLFALAHTVTIAFPIHVLIGFYLVWLRYRSDSLLPCMVFHAGYNAAVIMLAIGRFG